MVKRAKIPEFFNHYDPVVKGDSTGEPIKLSCPRCGKVGIVLFSPDGVFCPYCDYNFGKSKSSERDND